MFDVKRLVEEVTQQEDRLFTLCGQFDPATVPLEHAARVYEAFARMEKLVAGARLRLAARVEESDHWRRTGHRNSGRDPP
jgi:hypothetical protein